MKRLPLNGLTVWTVLLLHALPLNAQDKLDSRPHFASGIKVGEVDQSSAIIWVRLTKASKPHFDKLRILSEGVEKRANPKDRMPLEVVPGMAGSAKVEYWIGDNNSNRQESQWAEINSSTDFTHQFRLQHLQPGKEYQFSVVAKPQPTGGNEVEPQRIDGRFRTAPSAQESRPIKFIVSTCQRFAVSIPGIDGHVAYQQMLEYVPDFFVHTGDILYYDKVPFCKTTAEARANGT